ncbi:MAG: hypothetical protein GF334_09790 [Candidatus Altiarchaeales archaeon]|nr:hypothetical protein [Candidatus Altiarchaeales archaeon]
MRTRFWLALSLIVSLPLLVSAIDDLMELQGDVDYQGDPLASGDVRIEIWDDPTAGNKVYDSGTDFDGKVVAGKFDIVLGNSSTELTLQNGRIYWMEVFIQAQGQPAEQDMDFDGQERQIFMSSVGNQMNFTEGEVIVHGDLNVTGNAYLNLASIEWGNLSVDRLAVGHSKLPADIGDVNISGDVWVNGTMRGWSPLKVGGGLNVTSGDVTVNGTVEVPVYLPASDLNNTALFSVQHMQLAQLEGGAYFGGVGLTESKWGLSNYGATWSEAQDTGEAFYGVAVSSDGRVQTAVDTGGKVFVSYADVSTQGSKVVDVPRSHARVVAASDSYSQNADYVCDGTNDEVEIQQALDDVGNGAVMLLDGTFTIANPIVLRSNESLLGQGAGTRVYLDDATDSSRCAINVSEGSSGVSVSDLRINMTGGSGDYTGVVVEKDSKEISLSRLWISAAGGTGDYAGIKLLVNVSRVKILDSWIINMLAGDASSEGNDGIYVDEFADNDVGRNLLIEGVTVMNVSDDCLDVNDMKYGSITGNYLVGCGDNGIDTEGSQYSSITGNVIERVGGHGIELEEEGTDEVKFCTVTGNVVHGANFGIHLQVANHNTVGDNTINNTVRGISLDDSSNNIISDNLISGSTWCLYETGTSQENVLTFNKLIDCTYGSSLTDSSWVGYEKNQVFIAGDQQKNASSVFSVQHMQLAQLEGGAYFGRVGLNEQKWGLSEYGANWSMIQDTTENLSDIAMSSDGRYQSAVDYNGKIFVSSDFGASWSEATDTLENLTSVAMSSDGRIQTAVDDDVDSPSRIFGSNNFGKHWTTDETLNSEDLRDVAMSSDGRIQTAVDYNGKIFVSTDYGVGWSEATDTGEQLYGVAVSSDGRIQAASDYVGGKIFVSTDYGSTWSEATDTGEKIFKIAMSSDGKVMTAVDYDGKIYVSYANTNLRGDVDIIGDLNVTGDAYLNLVSVEYGNMTVDRLAVGYSAMPADIGDVNISGDVWVNGTMWGWSPLKVGGGLNVTSGDVAVNGTVEVPVYLPASDLNNTALFSVQHMQLAQLEGGAYFGGVGLTESKWGLSNYGATWSEAQDTSEGLVGVALSSDGRVQTAVDAGGKIFVSYADTHIQSKVGIGTDSPTQELTVIGDLNVTGHSDFASATFSSDVDILGDLNVTGDTYLNLASIEWGNLSVDRIAVGDAVMPPSVGDVNVSGDVWVNGTMYGWSPLKVGDGLNVTGKVQLGNDSSQTHAINTNPVSDRMLTSSFTSSGTGFIYGHHQTMITSGSGNAKSYGKYLDLDITGAPSGFDPDMRGYSSYTDLDDTGTYDLGEGDAIVYGLYNKVDFSGSIVSYPSYKQYGVYNRVQGNIDDSSSSTKYGTYNDVVGTADTSYAGYFSASGADTNYGVFVAKGDLAIDGDDQALLLGDGQDANITYDGSNLIIDPDLVGSGQLYVDGELNVSSDLYLGGDLYGADADIAENFDVEGELEAGGVVVVSEKDAETLVPSATAYNTAVAGVISTDPAYILNSENNGLPLALAGRVSVKVCNESGAIKPGDLLTTSSVPAHAMRCGDKTRCFGAVIGKALEEFQQEEGTIKMLVMLG